MHSDPRTTVAFIVNMRRDADFAILLPALRRWKAHRPGLHRAATAALRFTVLWVCLRSSPDATSTAARSASTPTS